MSSTISQLLSSLYRVGDKVTIDGFEEGYILEKKNSGGSLTFKIRTQLCNKIYNDVSVERIAVVNLYGQPESTNRSGFRRDISFSNRQEQSPTSRYVNTSINNTQSEIINQDNAPTSQFK